MGRRSILFRTEATSFDEAFELNRLKIRAEVDRLQTDPQPLKKGELGRPAFWQGCHTANQVAWAKYDSRLKKLIAQLAADLKQDAPGIAATEDEVRGFQETMATIIKALQRDNPSEILNA